jgi:HEPN domain-containing protein
MDECIKRGLLTEHTFTEETILKHESLYGIDYEPLEDDARSGIEYAKRFIEAVENILRDPNC